MERGRGNYLQRYTDSWQEQKIGHNLYKGDAGVLFFLSSRHDRQFVYRDTLISQNIGEKYCFGGYNLLKQQLI